MSRLLRTLLRTGLDILDQPYRVSDVRDRITDAADVMRRWRLPRAARKTAARSPERFATWVVASRTKPTVLVTLPPERSASSKQVQ